MGQNLLLSLNIWLTMPLHARYVLQTCPKSSLICNFCYLNISVYATHVHEETVYWEVFYTTNTEEKPLIESRWLLSFYQFYFTLSFLCKQMFFILCGLMHPQQNRCCFSDSALITSQMAFLFSPKEVMFHESKNLTHLFIRHLKKVIFFPVVHL